MQILSTPGESHGQKLPVIVPGHDTILSAAAVFPHTTLFKYTLSRTDGWGSVAWRRVLPSGKWKIIASEEKPLKVTKLLTIK